MIKKFLLCCIIIPNCALTSFYFYSFVNYSWRNIQYDTPKYTLVKSSTIKDGSFIVCSVYIGANPIQDGRWAKPMTNLSPTFEKSMRSSFAKKQLNLQAGTTEEELSLQHSILDPSFSIPSLYFSGTSMNNKSIHEYELWPLLLLWVWPIISLINLFKKKWPQEMLPVANA